MTAIDHAPLLCRFHDSDTCRGGLDVDEHALTTHGWLHPTEFDPRTGRPIWPEGVTS